MGDGGRIFEAWSDEGWTVEGAAVRVSIVCFSRGVVGPSAGLNGLPVPRINADLTGGAKTVDLTQAASLASNKNLAFQGVKFGGPFEITGDDARSEEHTSELQSLMRISYAVFCLKKKKQQRD